MILEWVIVGGVLIGWNIFLYYRMKKDERERGE